jgi:hypothetical protein
MEAVAVEGVFEDGQVRLLGTPPDVKTARVVVTFLEDTGEDSARRRAAGKRLLESMREGLNFGGQKFNREELYEERLSELDRRRG